MKQINALLFFFFLFCSFVVQGQKMEVDSLALSKNDSVKAVVDSIPRDSMKNKTSLQSRIDYSANDSIIFMNGNKGYLYGNSDIKTNVVEGENTKTIELKGEKTSIDMKTGIVESTYGLDSANNEFGYPQFLDNSTMYEMKNLRYNIKSQKLFVQNVVTKEGEGYITASQAKRLKDNSFCMLDGKYTTCNITTNPHFYLNMTKAKIRPGKNIVTGPAYFVLLDVPLPVFIPFGFFPFKKKYSSGFLLPTPGEEFQRGFYLMNGGYYLALNDNIDFKLTGDIYSKGSWSANAQSRYFKRYKYSGGLDFQFLKTVFGDKGTPQYESGNDFRISWTHSQDPKANPFRTLSASVNYTSSTFNRKSLSDLYSRRSTQNTKSSSINFSQTIPNTPWRLSGNVSINQTQSDSTVALTLPSLMVNMSRIYPFKRKEAVGAQRWYEKIDLTYSGQFSNQIRTKEYLLFKKNVLKDWSNGIRHELSSSMTLNLLNNINITPSIRYSEYWYSKKIKQHWDQGASRIMQDTVYGFNRIFNFSASIGLTTKLYGMYTPLPFFKKLTGNRLNALRHIFSPSISFSYAPDFSNPMFKIYDVLRYNDSKGNPVEHKYSYYSGPSFIFGSPSSGKSNLLSFSFDNNLEMKLNTPNDSVKTKVVSLIDNFGVRFSYNFAAKEFKLSDISADLRVKLTKSYTLSLQGSFDPYLYGLDKSGNPVRLNKLRISKGIGFGFGRLRSTGMNFSYTFDENTLNNWFSKNKKKTKEKEENFEEDDDNPLEKLQRDDEKLEQKLPQSLINEPTDNGKYDKNGYAIPEIKWSFSFDYSIRYGWSGEFDKKKMEYKGRFTQSLGFHGSLQPTRNWSMNFNADYDFIMKRMTFFTCSLTRNLHCWSMSANINPIGPYKSYNFVIQVNSSLLRDLKYKMSSSPYDGLKWY